MKFTSTRLLSETQKRQIHELWNKEYPEKMKHAALSDFELYLSPLEHHSHILMIDDSDTVRGWYFDFIRENQRWFAIIVDSSQQGKGYGTQLLKLAKGKEPELNGWVVPGNEEIKQNGEPYVSPLHFYLKNGFQVIGDKPFSIKNTTVLKINWHR